MRATGDEVAFFDAGGVVLALYPWDKLAEDAACCSSAPSQGFRGLTLARNCRSDREVEDVLAHALSVGGHLLRRAQPTSYGGYSGYFTDPDGHVWEVVRAPGFEYAADGRLILPD